MTENTQENTEKKETQLPGFEVAPYYFELTTEVLALVEPSKYEMAMDHFQAEMWEYAEAYWQVVDDAFKKAGDLPGVATYEISENMAKVLVGKSTDELVSVDEFKKSARHVVNKWMGLDKELDVDLSR